MSTTTPEINLPDPLDADQRCDRCDAQAVVVVMLAAVQLDLLFCGHHWREHRAAVLAADVVVHIHPLPGTP